MSAAHRSKGSQPCLLNHPLAQNTLFNGYLPSRSSPFWDLHLKAPAFVYEYLSVLDRPVVVKRQVLDWELLLLEDICVHMEDVGWAAWGQISQPCLALAFEPDLGGPSLGQKAEHLLSVRKVKCVLSRLRVGSGLNPPFI